MCAGSRQDTFDPTCAGIDFVHAVHKARHCAGADGHMATDFHIVIADCAGHNGDGFTSDRVFHFGQIMRD